MADDAIRAARLELTEKMLGAGLFLSNGVRGAFGRGPVLADLTQRLNARISELCAPDKPELVSFPPVLPREVLRKTGYMENFPQLCGSIHSFMGEGKGADGRHAELLERVRAGEDWAPSLGQTALVLTPAACYPLYPTLTGSVPKGGKLFDLRNYCFRHEPSEDPARMQSFEMRENVRVGTPDEVQDWRKGWLTRGKAFIESIGLEVVLDTAHDPFFGRGGRLMKASQAQLELKFELLVPVWSKDEPTAVASFNYHQEHFGKVFDIRSEDGAHAHTACLGFGIDRIAIGLFRRHGLDPRAWPAEVRRALYGSPG